MIFMFQSTQMMSGCDDKASCDAGLFMLKGNLCGGFACDNSYVCVHTSYTSSDTSKVEMNLT